ncbi:maleylacetate reductase [Rhizobium anhuiense]|uniref:maleylacetate reductase n=1 Tax=Rhizobium anhuiense TaxID=1184720 RepID=UPI0020CCAAC4|nr:maleylacetate reductase [Rhizobium anhuiense]UTS93872.1 maleylacetate reductase [Rhizobium anhuiense bv. trifolii]
MEDFVYTGLATRVIFGTGTLKQLADEAKRLGMSRPLVLSTPHQVSDAERVAGLIGPQAAVFSGAVMHTPVEVTMEAMKVAAEAGADGVIAIGGGSTTGLSKAIALRTDLPQLIVPTTYAGSEMTPILGQTENGSKTTLRDNRVLPETVIYDVSLTLGLPVGLSAVSGLNAIAHAVEALYARDRNPVTDLMAEDGIRALARALPRIGRDGLDVEARSDALYGAWLCGISLGCVGMALHHKLCHTLGGMFDLPHAETHSVILPYVMRYNMQAAPDAAQKVARALRADNAATGLRNLAQEIGAPLSLAQIGMPAEGIGTAAIEATSNPYWNPAPVTEPAIRALLTDAFDGVWPD